jgi:hypothetical protein
LRRHRAQGVPHAQESARGHNHTDNSPRRQINNQVIHLANPLVLHVPYGHADDFFGALDPAQTVKGSLIPLGNRGGTNCGILEASRAATLIGGTGRGGVGRGAGTIRSGGLFRGGFFIRIVIRIII